MHSPVRVQMHEALLSCIVTELGCKLPQESEILPRADLDARDRITQHAPRTDKRASNHYGKGVLKERLNARTQPRKPNPSSS